MTIKLSEMNSNKSLQTQLDVENEDNQKVKKVF